jgi:hypothetical protein
MNGYFLDWQILNNQEKHDVQAVSALINPKKDPTKTKRHDKLGLLCQCHNELR